MFSEKSPSVFVAKAYEFVCQNNLWHSDGKKFSVREISLKYDQFQSLYRELRPTAKLVSIKKAITRLGFRRKESKDGQILYLHDPEFYLWKCPWSFSRDCPPNLELVCPKPRQDEYLKKKKTPSSSSPEFTPSFGSQTESPSLMKAGLCSRRRNQNGDSPNENEFIPIAHNNNNTNTNTNTNNNGGTIYPTSKDHFGGSSSPFQDSRISSRNDDSSTTLLLDTKTSNFNFAPNRVSSPVLSDNYGIKRTQPVVNFSSPQVTLSSNNVTSNTLFFPPSPNQLQTTPSPDNLAKQFTYTGSFFTESYPDSLTFPPPLSTGSPNSDFSFQNQSSPTQFSSMNAHTNFNGSSFQDYVSNYHQHFYGAPSFEQQPQQTFYNGLGINNNLDFSSTIVPSQFFQNQPSPPSCQLYNGFSTPPFSEDVISFISDLDSAY